MNPRKAEEAQLAEDFRKRNQGASKPLCLAAAEAVGALGLADEILVAMGPTKTDPDLRVALAQVIATIHAGLKK
jgi:hypothetical protein